MTFGSQFTFPVTSVLNKMALSFLAFVILLKVVTFSTSEETCERIDTCSCKLKNGSTVSLQPVDRGSEGPRFTGIKSEGTSGRTYDWNPCTPFSTDTPGSECKDVMVCQVAVSEAVPAGTKDSTFSVDGEGNVVILYGGSKDSTGYTRQTEITLKCDQSINFTKPASFKETKTSQSSIYSGTFISKYACATGGSSGHLSVGSILLIIFFPLVVMYVIIGILINRYGRGIESMPELLPNHSFWADFPFLVKDGVVFTCGCIKSACSSLSNKCGKSGYAEI